MRHVINRSAPARTHRTLNSAFGPYARLHVPQRKRSFWLARVIALLGLLALVLTAVIALMDGKELGDLVVGLGMALGCGGLIVMFAMGALPL